MVGATAVRFSLAAWCLVSLASCGGTPESPKTLTWYQAHPQELEEKVRWCEDDPNRRNIPDCRTALVAAGRKQMGTMSEAPALDWNKPDPKHEN